MNFNFQNPFGKKSSLDELAESLGNAHLSYSSEGRSGTVYYRSDVANFSMWWEFGSGDAIAIINIPEPKYWEAQTGILLDQRDAVLDFIGQQVLKDQVSSGRGRYEIEGSFLTIYRA